MHQSQYIYVHLAPTSTRNVFKEIVETAENSLSNDQMSQHGCTRPPSATIVATGYISNVEVLGEGRTKEDAVRHTSLSVHAEFLEGLVKCSALSRASGVRSICVRIQAHARTSECGGSITGKGKEDELTRLAGLVDIWRYWVSAMGGGSQGDGDL